MKKNILFLLALSWTGSFAQMQFELKGKFDTIYSKPCDQDCRKKVFGGISGMEYDPFTNTYLFVSDSQDFPRIYRASISLDSLDQKKIIVKQPTPFYLSGETHVPSTGLEAIRIHPETQDIYFVVEQDVGRTAGCIIRRRISGEYNEYRPFDTYIFPDNKCLEGLCFSEDGKSVYVSFEAYTKEDGLLWIGMFDLEMRPLSAFSYKPQTPLKDLPYEISEIERFQGDTLLVLERVYSYKEKKIFARVQAVDLHKRKSIPCNPALPFKTCYSVFPETVLDLKNFLPETHHTDNLEGMTLGPKYPDGKASLVLISDDNFNGARGQVTQVLVFKQK